MGIRLSGAGVGHSAKLWLGAWLAFCGPLIVAQQSLISAPEPVHAARARRLADKLPDKPSVPPAFTIPITPLGFSTPGSFYLGQRTAMVSLDFLDENRLLFTFRVPGLIHRNTTAHEASGEDERQIRAVVLDLPTGAVEAETLWTLHDRLRYLWMLKDGHFLLRDERSLQIGDASLELKPYLRFPGPLLWVETDPTEQFLATNSREPATQKTGELAGPGTHAENQDATAQRAEAGAVEAEQQSSGLPEIAVRVLRRDTGKVILVSRTRTAVHLPINADGYLEALHGAGNAWVVNMNYFSGKIAPFGRVESACAPLASFLSQREALIVGCNASGGAELAAMTTGGRKLWQVESANTTVWPQLVRAPDGSRLARETLVVSTPIGTRSALDPELIRGQLVEVIDAADGKTVLEAAASPALDAGGNVAISPSGRRIAVIGGGQIQVFELPPAAQFPATASPAASH